MSGESGNAHTGIEIGRTLRLAREKRGLSLQQVEEATKIRTRYLRDLENENFDVLPAVYVLGSLKTYAEHIGLDGAAITGELKRRQASMQGDQAREGPPSREPRGLVASLARLVGIGGTVEDEAGTMAPVRRPGLYVSLGVVLIFVLATYLASSIRGEDRQSVSVVQEPTLSRLPSGIALVGNVEDERKADDVSTDKQAESPVEDDKFKPDQSGKEEYSPSQAPSFSATASASPSATATADASASASSAYAGSAPAAATTSPTRVRPEPADREQRGGEGVVAPAGPPARVSGSQGLRETQEGPFDTTWFGNGVPNTVKKAVNGAP
jgi:cytoskeletal protein RodZ